MRKYVVPIVALLGIALLSPRTEAANLIIKSRAASAGTNVWMPVAATNVAGTGQLWGLDFALNFDTTKISVGTDPGGNGTCFSPQAVSGSTEVPVVVSGTTFVGTGATNPSLYVGIVRGTSAFNTAANATGQPNNASIGILRLALAATGPVNGEVLNLTVPPTYNVANTGDGSTTNARAGATGATSDATAGSAVNAETITVLDNMPVTTQMAVPLHKIAVAPAGPGDVVSGGGIVIGDLSKLANGLLGKSAMTDYNKIAGDIAPNSAGFVPHTSYGGTYGLSYGDGMITVGDVALLAKFRLGTATNFPVNE